LFCVIFTAAPIIEKKSEWSVVGGGERGEGTLASEGCLSRKESHNENVAGVIGSQCAAILALLYPDLVRPIELATRIISCHVDGGPIGVG